MAPHEVFVAIDEQLHALSNERGATLLDKLMQEQEPDSVKTLAMRFGDLKKLYDAVDKVAKEVGALWDANEKALVEAMIEEGISSIKIDGYGLFKLSRSVYPNVSSANKPTFFEYLKHSGNSDLLKLDVPTNTLTAFLKRHQDALKADLQQEGIHPWQAPQLAKAFPEKYSDVAKSLGKPLDEFQADEVAKDILQSWGAAMFSKSVVSLTK